MGYVMVKGGQEAIEASNNLIKYYRLKDAEKPLEINMIVSQMRYLVDRIMGEGSLYSPEYAALALKQANGDISESVFLLRAYRSTLSRNYYSTTIDTSNMRIIRRISSAFKDIPGGQILGPTYDYAHRLLNFSIINEDSEYIKNFVKQFERDFKCTDSINEGLTFKKVVDVLRKQGFLNIVPIPQKEESPFDVTRNNITYPLPRSARLQILARGETGAMISLAYSSMRGYGIVHPTIGELRTGYVSVYIEYPYDDSLRDTIYIGEIMITEVEVINSFAINKSNNEDSNVEYSLGYGLCFGNNESKAISMAILESSIEKGGTAPAQDEEFVLTHIDSIESYGFISHLKLPHYVTFQASLDRIKEASRKKAEKQGE